MDRQVAEQLFAPLRSFSPAFIKPRIYWYGALRLALRDWSEVAATAAHCLMLRFMVFHGTE